MPLPDLIADDVDPYYRVITSVDLRPPSTGYALAQSSLNLIWAAVGLRADSVRPQCVNGQRVPIAAHVKFGDDCANA